MERGHLQPSLDVNYSGSTASQQGDSSTDSCRVAFPLKFTMKVAVNVFGQCEAY